MGCGSTKITTVKKVTSPEENSTIQGTFAYHILVDSPKTSEVLKFELSYDFSSCPLERIMTILSFDEKQREHFNSNFLYLYCSEENSYVHYLQCLVGVEISDSKSPSSGNIWVPYVNGQMMNWDKICKTMYNVKYSDEVIWRYHSQTADARPSVHDAPSP